MSGGGYPLGGPGILSPGPLDPMSGVPSKDPPGFSLFIPPLKL